LDYVVDASVVIKWFVEEDYSQAARDLLKERTILVDVRIGQYADGRSHDHSTGFRVSPDKLDLCFASRQRVM
jgi:hypothetical protein